MISRILLVLVTLCVAGTAHAQLLNNIVLPYIPGYDVGPDINIMSRPRPEFESQGVRTGNFIIRPNVSEAVGYNDNVLGTRGTGSSPSALVETQAGIQATSDWSRNSFGAVVSVDDQRYLAQPTLSQTDWGASLGGTYEIGEQRFTLAASHLQLYEETTGLDSFSLVPLPYTVDDVRANVLTSFGRISLRPQLEFTAYRFGEVPGSIGVRDSDRNAIQGLLTTEYELAPLRNIVLTVQANQQHYVRAQPLTPRRDSTGGAISFGIDYEATAKIRYFALAGYQIREYNNNAYKNHAAPIFNLGLMWAPTALTTVSLSSKRSIEESSDDTQSGYTLTQIGIAAEHEYLRNVILRASVNLLRADYQKTNVQNNLNEMLYSVGTSVTWILNRNISLRLSETFSTRDISNGIPSSGNLVLLRLGAAL